METVREPGSFRDPSGFLFEREGALLRHVDARYATDYDLLMGSGLYENLAEAGLLIPHQEVSNDLTPVSGAHRVLAPERVPFVSYPYEWCFGQLKQAALSTLEIQRRALDHGLVLKDASAFNMQFVGTRAVLIDTLSFERYHEGAPWVAYHQFCQHFLAPLELMAGRDIRLSRLFSSFLDGVPLDLASRLLPVRSWARFGTLLHLHLHARSVRRFSDTSSDQNGANSASADEHPVKRVSRTGLDGLIQSLESTVRKIRWNPEATEWAGYEGSHAYAPESRVAKEEIVREFLASTSPRTVWDLGANTGTFSRMAAERAEHVLALDLDPGAVEKHFRQLEAHRGGAILPLCIDLSNPTPGLGWQGTERMSLFGRGPADLILALALVHHLAISGNVPFGFIAEGFARMGRHLIIEFVPKSDPQVRRLLRSRVDVFDTYSEESFLKSFSPHFRLIERRSIPSSGRVMYLMAGLGSSDSVAPPANSVEVGDSVGG